jgi:hypothetical protein
VGVGTALARVEGAPTLRQVFLLPKRVDGFAACFPFWQMTPILPWCRDGGKGHTGVTACLFVGGSVISPFGRWISKCFL